MAGANEKKRARDSDDMTEEDAIRRTLRFLLSIARERVLASKTLKGGFSIGNSHWYTFEGEECPTSEADTSKLEAEMKEMIKDVSIIEAELGYLEAIKYFEQRFQGQAYYRLRHFPLVSSGDQLADKAFSVRPYSCGGFVLVNGAVFNDQPAIAKSIQRQATWSRRADVWSTAHICSIQDAETARGVLIFSAEARLEAQIVECTQKILHRHTQQGGIKVICIAGPTASGKTTFAHKLSLSLRSYGIESSPLTVDHYYLPLDEQPKYKIKNDRGDVDYDSIESMDIELVQSHIMQLSNGEEVVTPVYNMKTGYRDPPGKKMSLTIKPGSPPPVLIIEGIHALNPEYTAKIPAENKFKIFISPIPALQLDDYNVVKSTDHRLCRRMSRDYLFRGNDAARTLKMWSNVRRGEERWIFPHQNEADYVINSAMEYEMPVLKARLEGMLRGVSPLDGSEPLKCPVFAKATLLLHMLDSVPAWQDTGVPCASLMREFIGGSAFDVH